MIEHEHAVGRLPDFVEGRQQIAKVNLGSSFGTAIAGTILVSVVELGTRSYAVAMIVLAGFGLLGLLAAIRLPADTGRVAATAASRPVEQTG